MREPSANSERRTAQTLILCGRLFDGIHDDLQEHMEILLEGNTIKAVGENLKHESDAKVIDLRHLTVTPGMIDAHVHPHQYDWRTFWSNFMYESPEYHALTMLRSLQHSLERGFTSIRCSCGIDNGYGIVDVKKAINQGLFSGPRVCAGGHVLGTPGSHCDFTGQISAGNPYMAEIIRPDFIGNGPDFFRRGVRNEVRYGSDFVKIMVSGGFATPNDGPEDQQMSDCEIEAFLETANALHVSSTAHVYAPYLMQKLMKHHISGMEHGSLMDEETARMFEETDTFLVPTFCPYDDIIAGDEESLAKKEPYFRDKLRVYGKRLAESRKIIVDSKIRLGYGTDLVSVHSNWESWHEYASWMDSGMDPYRILHAATSVNAGILGMDRITGTIEPGKRADISAWHRDLLTDRKALSECDFVMKDGVEYETVYSTD